MITYKAGACNIGAHEVRKRYILFFIGMAASVACILLINIYRGSIVLYAIAYFVFSTTILLGIQARKKFCVKYALSGRFNFQASGKGEKVCNVDDRKSDIQKARGIIILSYSIGLLFLICIFFLCDYHKL